MGEREGRRVLDALEAYLGRSDSTQDLRTAFLAGVQLGMELARELFTLSTGANGHANRVPPLKDPPFTTSPIGFTFPDPFPDPLVDPKSTGRANFEHGTLELFPRRVPLEPRRKPRCRVPDDFTLSPELRRFAEAGGLDPAQELAAMKDQYRATGEPRADWSATFRQWCRRSLELRGRRP